MNKSDLNSSMLFKIRDEGLCVLLNRNGDNFQVFYNKNNIVKGHAWGISSLNDDYNNDLKCNHYYTNEFDIISIKQYKSCSEVISMILKDQEPEEWDWVEEIEKPKEEKIEEIKNPIPAICNVTFNIIVDPTTNTDDLVRELSDEISKYPDKMFKMEFFF